MRFNIMLRMFLIAAALFNVFVVLAQPKPGKEKITVSLPKEYRWKSNKIPKDTKAIRGTSLTVTGNEAASAPVKQITITTIDRRYFPMKADGSPQEKWEYEKADCPECLLEIVNRQTHDNRTSIVYAVRGIRLDGGPCGEATLIAYIAEGPTAFHTIELTIANDALTPELFKAWCDTLLQSRIE